MADKEPHIMFGISHCMKILSKLEFHFYICRKGVPMWEQSKYFWPSAVSQFWSSEGTTDTIQPIVWNRFGISGVGGSNWEEMQNGKNMGSWKDRLGRLDSSSRYRFLTPFPGLINLNRSTQTCTSSITWHRSKLIHQGILRRPVQLKDSGSRNHMPSRAQKRFFCSSVKEDS